MQLLFFWKWIFYSIILIFIKYYNIVIAMNTQTTMNNQFETLNAPKHLFSLLISHSYALKQHIFHFLYIHPKNSKILILIFLKVYRAIQSWFLVINKWVAFILNFYVLGEAKQVISLVEGMKSIFYPNLFALKTSL